jgi:hypothetical protein
VHTGFGAVCEQRNKNSIVDSLMNYFHGQNDARCRVSQTIQLKNIQTHIKMELWLVSGSLKRTNRTLFTPVCSGNAASTEPHEYVCEFVDQN